MLVCLLICACLSVCQTVCSCGLCVCLSICLSVFLSVPQFIHSAFLYVCKAVFMAVSISVHLSGSMSFIPYIDLSVCHWDTCSQKKMVPQPSFIALTKFDQYYQGALKYRTNVTRTNISPKQLQRPLMLSQSWVGNS